VISPKYALGAELMARLFQVLVGREELFSLFWLTVFDLLITYY
jgi:hypothetical protein